MLIVGAILLRKREPVYLGKTLSEWEEIYVRDSEGPAQSEDTPACRAAVDAIRGMRDKAMPLALKLIRYEKPTWKTRVERILERIGARRWAPAPIWRPFYGDPAYEGPVYFKIIGPAASPAIPELVQIIRDAKSPSATGRAFDALEYIGKEALPPLMELLADKSGSTRYWAAVTIGETRHRQPGVARPAVPLLVKCMQDPDPQIAVAAITVLGNLRLEADSAVPALAKSLSSTDPRLRSCAAESLEKFGVEARSAVPLLVNALSDPNYGVRWAATNALRQVDGGVYPPVPLVTP